MGDCCIQALLSCCCPWHPAAQSCVRQAHSAPPAQITKLLELLVNVLSDTQGRIEKRQAQTYEELMVGGAPGYLQVSLLAFGGASWAGAVCST